MPNTELERLVAVETNLANLTKAVEKSSDETKAAIKELAGAVGDLTGNYIPRTEYDKDLELLRVEIDQSKRRTAFQTWVTGSLSAVLGAVLAILTQAYFNK